MQSASVNWRGVSPIPRAFSTGKTRSSSTPSRSRVKSQRHIKKPSLSAFQRGVLKARALVDSATTPEELETRLQTLLRGSKYSDAAFLIVASSYLSERFQTPDVARLMLEQAKSPQALEKVAQFVRDLQLQSNNELVTLLINEMVRALQFNAAVRLAQEMVPGFEQLSASVATVKRPCWTPLALIQAMVRARKFRAALKYSKQFGLLETFPAPQLVVGMLETRCWEEAISSIMEMQLFKEFPLEALAVEMMKQRQWSQAAKCMNKMSDRDDARIKFYEALVCEAAHVGDFVTSLRYLREFKLHQGTGVATVNLLRYLVDAMLAHGEFYKAIKYAIKFKLAKNPLDDAIAAAEAALAAVNGEEVPHLSDDHTEYLPQYNVEILIRKAIAGGQFHVATTYIKRLRLREKFAEELVAIEKAQQTRLLEFRQYAQLRLAQFQDAALQQSLRALLGDQADDELVELELVEEEIVLSVEEEIFPCGKKTRQVKEEEEEEESELSIKERCQAFVSESNKTDETQQRESNAPVETSDESRFGFARAPPQPPLPSDPVSEAGVSGVEGDNLSRIKPLSHVKGAPPGLFSSSEPESVQDQKQDDTGGFNFANFAKSFHGSDPPPPPNPASSSLPLQQSPPQQPPQQQPHLSQQQQVQAMFGQLVPNGQFASGPPGYPMPPMMPQQSSIYFPGGNMPPSAMQPRGYLQPPPPPPLPSNNGGGAFDVAALAMQFHNGGGSNDSSGFSGFGGPRPPMGYLSAPLNGQQQQQLFRGMPPPPFSAPPPQSAFKPSMSYTSITTTRQKK
ncbi:unnamed protein product [Peronospora farinosa]|uniref:Pentacotripeptide-repeat region of PRORP domain-containing protein n=3 Tax=Peronospora farinosa TaxID=134698 RepID=A0AAV0SXY4_9STRA|nr:unnamed protein product [Peronospora farinosa]CAI5708577.1 unnamed protein product [Peronospora farinosa]